MKDDFARNEHAFPDFIPLKLLISGVLICYCCSQIFAWFNPFKKFGMPFYIVILFCVLVSRHDHILLFSYHEDIFVKFFYLVTVRA